MSRYGEHSDRQDRVMASGATPKRMMNNRNKGNMAPRFGSNRGHLPLIEAMSDSNTKMRATSPLEALLMAAPGDAEEFSPTRDIEGIRDELELILSELEGQEWETFFGLFVEGLSWLKTARQVTDAGYPVTKWQVRNFETRWMKILTERFERFL